MPPAEAVQPHRAAGNVPTEQTPVPVSPQLQRIRDVKAQLKKFLNDVTGAGTVVLLLTTHPTPCMTGRRNCRRLH